MGFDTGMSGQHKLTTQKWACQDKWSLDKGQMKRREGMLEGHL
jgi:hypothetical protein